MRREPSRPKRVASATMRANQRRLIRGRPGHVALCRPRLAGDLAGPPLRHRVLVRAGGCRPAPLGRAQKFPAATSRTIALASA